MRKSTKPTHPSKPHKDFPVFPHRNGQWCKKVRGKLYYFGVWSKPHAALEKWLHDKDSLLAGRTPRTTPDDGVSLADVCNHFLTHKNAMLAAEEIAPRTFQTIAEGSLDLVAVSHIMGHAPPARDMTSIYRQRVSDARLQEIEQPSKLRKSKEEEEALDRLIDEHRADFEPSPLDPISGCTVRHQKKP